MARSHKTLQHTAAAGITQGIDARAKIAVLTVLSVAVWSLDTAAGLCLTILICLSWLMISGKVAAKVFRGLFKLWAVFLIVFFYYLWASYSLIGQLALDSLPEALAQGLMLSGKLAMLIATALWIYFSTSPVKVADSMTDLLRPLEKIGVPVGELGFTVGLVIRAFPSALGRIRVLFNNFLQQGKLTDSGGGFISRFYRISKAVVDTMVCYMHYTLYEAELLSLGLMARGYNPFRTHSRQASPPLSSADLVFCVLSSAAVVLTSYFL